MTKLTRMIAVPIAAALMLTSPQGGAQAQSVDELVRSMTTTLAEAQAFTVHVEKTFEVVLVDGNKVQFAGAMDLAIRRPDRLWVSYGDDLSAKEAWYDGSKFTLHDLRADVYGALPAKPTIDETLDALSAQYGVFLPLAELFSSDAYEEFTGKVIEKLYVGQNDVGGQATHHLFFTGEHAAWQVWLPVDGPSVPLKLVVTRTEIPELPQQVFVFSDWDLAADLPDEDFVPEIPASASLAAFLPKEGN